MARPTRTLNTTVTDANYTAGTGQLLASVGTVIALEKGPDSDMFFLSFDQIGKQDARAYRADGAAVAAPPMTSPSSSRTWACAYSTSSTRRMASVTGVSMNDTGVQSTYNLVEQQLPSVPTMESFLASNQVGVAQLAIQYCDSLVESSSAGTFFPGLNFAAAPGTAFANSSLLIDPLISHGVGTGIATQPADADVRAELNSLMSKLSSCGASCANSVRTKTIAKAACAAVLGSGAMLIK